MRIIDRKWTELAAGYRAAGALQAKLEGDFGRAIEVGQQQQYLRELAGWKKKRRVFIAFAVIAPISIIALCLSAYYFREVACVIVYWAIVVLVILVTLGVAARSYIGEMMNRPSLAKSDKLPADLENRWWTRLYPEEMMVLLPGRADKNDFLSMLADLPDTYLARRGPPVEGEDSLYVFAPSGPWIFCLRDWKGVIAREADQWRQVPKKGEAVIYSQAPDDQWVGMRNQMIDLFTERYPQTGGKIQGGVIFTHPKARLDKNLIHGNTAAYGPARSWAERLRNAPPMESGVTLELQLETLDALIAREVKPGEMLDLSNSGKELAMQLYQEAVTELRAQVAKMLG
jgi:hypothetical protein